MSQATTTLHGHSPQAKRAFGILFVAAAVASLLTATVLSNSQPSFEVPDASVAPAPPVAPVASPGTGVPEASTVFDGKDTPEEETAPTF
jgi:hypothetical protein